MGFTFSEQAHKNEENEGMLNALKATFRPEFLNRIDEIVIFNPLTQDEIEKIAEIMLKELEKRIIHRGMRVIFDPSVKQLLAKEGFDPVYGARPLRRATVRLIEDPFSTEILEGHIREGDLVTVTAKNGKILFEINQ
jgi:ATP-dependent Clp protease ATP-binding subunit ClpA